MAIALLAFDWRSNPKLYGATGAAWIKTFGAMIVVGKQFLKAWHFSPSVKELIVTVI